MTSDDLCSVEGCEKPRQHQRRMCGMHRRRRDRHGDPHYTPDQRIYEATIERFWAQVNKTDSCWLWTGETQRGYGRFGNVTVPSGSAHRFAWFITNGQIPDGLEIDHLCHTLDPTCAGGISCPHRACVNPSHLEPVTPQVNTLRSKSPSADNARKEVCPKCGGDYAVAKRGARKPGRWCPPCHSERRRQRKAERRERIAQAGQPCSPACPMLACPSCPWQNDREEDR
jgi:hypothetical protein